MVQLSATSRRVENASFILLEDFRVSLNSDRERGPVNRCLHLLNVVGPHNIVIISDIPLGRLAKLVVSFFFAGTIYTREGIIIFCKSMVLLPIKESSNHIAAAAAFVIKAICLSSTVDQLLLREKVIHIATGAHNSSL